MCLVREPTIKEPRTERQTDQERRHKAQPPGVFRTSWIQIKTSPKFIFCFLVLMDSYLIFTVMEHSLQSWISGVYDIHNPAQASETEDVQ